MDLGAYRAAIRARWDGVAVEPAVVHSVVRDATGREIVRRRRVYESWTNEVYEVKTDDGRRFAVRFARRSVRRFEGEAWALARCAAAGVPVPEVVAVIALASAEPMEACVQTWVEGERLVWAADRIGPVETCRLVEHAGELLARIHDIPVAGFGPVDGSGRGLDAAESVPAYDRATIDETALRLGLDRQLVLAAMEATCAAAPTRGAPVLAHGDLATKHIVVRRGRVEAVLDFETARGSDASYDIAVWDLINGPVPPRACLVRGYRRAGGQLREQSVAWWRCALRLRSLESNAAWYEENGVEPLAAGLSADLRVLA